MSAVVDRPAGGAPAAAVARRGAYLAAAVTLAAAAVLVHGWSWSLLVLALAPDLPLLFGGGSGLQRGQLHPRAVPFYNATHRFAGPLVLLLLGAAVLAVDGSSSWMVAALVWGAHLCADRAFGYGLRSPEGFVR